MKENPLIKIITLAKHKRGKGLFSTLKMMPVPLSQLQKDPSFTEDDFVPDSTYKVPEHSVNPIKEKDANSVTNYTSVNLQSNDEPINIKICNHSIPLSYSIKKFVQSLYAIDTLIIDMQPITEASRSITVLDLRSLIKKIRKIEPLLPIVFIFNSNANRDFLHHTCIGIEHSNVNIIYRKTDLPIYRLPLEAAARLGLRPRREILEFYNELQSKISIPFNAKFKDIINKAQNMDYPEYTKIAQERNWLTSTGELTSVAKSLLKDDKCYRTQIKTIDFEVYPSSTPYLG